MSRIRKNRSFLSFCIKFLPIQAKFDVSSVKISHILGYSRCYSESFRDNPRLSESFRDIPSLSESFRDILRHSGTFRVLLHPGFMRPNLYFWWSSSLVGPLPSLLAYLSLQLWKVLVKNTTIIRQGNLKIHKNEFYSS